MPDKVSRRDELNLQISRILRITPSDQCAIEANELINTVIENAKHPRQETIYYFSVQEVIDAILLLDSMSIIETLVGNSKEGAVAFICLKEHSQAALFQILRQTS